MANENVQGLLAELGLDAYMRDQAQNRRRAMIPNYGPGQAAAFMQLGNQLGANIGRAAAPATMGIISGLGAGFDGDKSTGFRSGFAGGFSEQMDRQDAAALGITPQELRAREATQNEIQDIQFEQTGDPIADQQAALKKIIEIANKNGDSAAVTKAMAKLQQLKADQLAFNKAEADASAQRTENQEAREDAALGREVFLPGDDRSGPTSSAVWNEDKQMWDVYRPDGSVKEVAAGGVIAGEPQARRVFQWNSAAGQMSTALKLNGFTPGKQIDDAKARLRGPVELAGVVGDAADGLARMFNPGFALSDSQKALATVERTSSFIGNAISAFGGPSDGKGKREETELVRNTDIYSSWLAEQGMDITDILPEHIKADTEEASLFQAQIMQLAYLDAREQEPSNRGLSDNDIKAALARIGAASPNPRVFARRWKNLLERAQSKVNNLGSDFVSVGNLSASDISNHIWPQAARRGALERIGAAIEKLDALIGEETEETVDLSGMTDAEIEAEILRMEAENANP